MLRSIIYHSLLFNAGLKPKVSAALALALKAGANSDPVTSKSAKTALDAAEARANQAQVRILFISSKLYAIIFRPK